MKVEGIENVYKAIEEKLKEHYKEYGRREIGIQVIRKSCLAKIEGPAESPEHSEDKIKNIVNAFSRLAECKRFDIDIKSSFLQENIIEIIYGDVTGFEVHISS